MPTIYTLSMDIYHLMDTYAHSMPTSYSYTNVLYTCPISIPCPVPRHVRSRVHITDGQSTNGAFRHPAERSQKNSSRRVIPYQRD